MTFSMCLGASHALFEGAPIFQDVLFSPVEEPPKIAQADINYLGTGNIAVNGVVSNLDVVVRAIPQTCEDPSLTYGDIKEDDMGRYLDIFYPTRSSDVIWTVICSFDQASEILLLDNLSSFPFAGEYPEEVTGYLEFTDQVDTNDDIALMASEIASGSTSNLQAAMRVARWINKEVEYDLLYNASIEKASTVFSEMRGTCDEYTALFMSMMRSLNIPVRYVSGYAYGNIYGAQFNSHAWAETYIDGQWIPMDPTYGEYAYVDALHFPLYYGVDGNQSTITTRWTPPGSVTIQRPAINPSINVETYSGFDEFLTFDVELSDDDVAVGDYILVKINVSNPTHYYVPVSIMISMTNSTSLQYGYQRGFAVVEPHSYRVRYHIIKVESCSAEYPYQCVNPTEIFVTGAGEITKSIYVKPWTNPSTNFDSMLAQVRMEEMEIQTGLQVIDFSIQNVFYSEPTVHLELKNTGNSILSNLRAKVNYDGVERTMHFGDMIINELAEDSIVLPLPADYGLYDLTINFTAVNFTHAVSTDVIYAPSPSLNISLSGDTVFSGFQDAEFDLEFAGSCSNKSMTISTATGSINVAPVLDSYHAVISPEYFVPGQNNITVSVECYDPFGTRFTFQDYFTIERQVVADLITRFIYPPVE
jgi:transglutaminase-like putative cysteine protease